MWNDDNVDYYNAFHTATFPLHFLLTRHYRSTGKEMMMITTPIPMTTDFAIGKRNDHREKQARTFHKKTKVFFFFPSFLLLRSNEGVVQLQLVVVVVIVT